MSRLLAINQRIKTAETIKKTTNALRLVAMSSHGILRKNKAALDFYADEINRLFLSLTAQETKTAEELEISADEATADTSESEPAAKEISNQKIACIVIGSQKGSCGNYNTGLAHYVGEHIRSPDALGNTYDLIVVGKKMRDTLLYLELEPVTSYDEFTVRNRVDLALDLTRVTFSATYKETRFFYTHPTSFFVHTHKESVFLKENFRRSPGSPDYVAKPEIDSDSSPVLYEQSYDETFNLLGFLALKASIENILANSLLAEASSRFLSMDSATHNAENLIETLHLEYNKLRQANITRELADLTAGFMQ